MEALSEIMQTTQIRLLAKEKNQTLNHRVIWLPNPCSFCSTLRLQLPTELPLSGGESPSCCLPNEL